MTLDQWLREATGNFLAGVQKRLAQEYRAHLEDSASAGGSGDPVALFGRPNRVRRELKRSYFSTEEFGAVQGTGERAGWFAVALMGGGAIVRLASAPTLAEALAVPSALLTVLAVWIFTRGWLGTRRAVARLYGCLAFALIILPGMFAEDMFGRVTAVCLSGLLLLMALQFPRSDARLRRTLELEGLA